MVLFERLAARAQYLIPQRGFSALVYRLMRSEVPWLKNLLINRFSALAGVDWSEARRAGCGSYASFNAFFTRELKPGARPADPDPEAVVCPCDGRISEHGNLDGDRLLQAKGHWYSLASLLADDPACGELRGGLFFTVYLSPADYHRVHMPLDGKLKRMIHVPGKLFSVAPFTVRQIPGLFARNERVVSVFEGPAGTFAQVLVGAMGVSCMETVWAGEIRRTPSRHAAPARYDQDGPALSKGAEMGRFNMGSTVILVLPRGAAEAQAGLQAGQRVRMGQRLGTLGR